MPTPSPRAFRRLDSEAAPWSIQLELRVAGQLDEGRLRDAFGRAVTLHPMARARKLPSRRTAHTERWEITPALDLEPLRAVDCADEAAVAGVREALLGMVVPLVESPPLRARLVRTPGGDRLMLNVNHAAMDAFGALRLMRSVASAYAGACEGGIGPDPIEARGHLGELTRAEHRTRTRRRLALAEKLTDMVVRPARVAHDGRTTSLATVSTTSR